MGLPLTLSRQLWLVDARENLRVWLGEL
eukprot:SAG31_NODE_27674_length_422_cov_0.798762_2_plen_27_part_01